MTPTQELRALTDSFEARLANTQRTRTSQSVQLRGYLLSLIAHQRSLLDKHNKDSRDIHQIADNARAIKDTTELIEYEEQRAHAAWADSTSDTNTDRNIAMAQSAAARCV